MPGFIFSPVARLCGTLFSLASVHLRARVLLSGGRCVPKLKKTIMLGSLFSLLLLRLRLRLRLLLLRLLLGLLLHVRLLQIN